MSVWTQLTANNGAQLETLTKAVNSVATTIGAVAGDVSNLHGKVDKIDSTVATQAALNGTAGSVTAENLANMQGVLGYFGGVKKLADGVTKALANTEELIAFSGQLKADLTDAAKEIVKTLNVLIEAVHGQDTAIRSQTAMIEDLAKRMAPANGEQAAPVTEDDPVVQKLANELAKKKILEILQSAQGIEKDSLAGKT
jgi:ABC-type transporter Mla subunit MlaD